MSILENNPLKDEIEKIQEVAGYLAERGWAERNGGNISVNVTELMTEQGKKRPALVPSIALPKAFKALAGHFFYVTGTGKRMRYVAKSAFGNGSIIRINEAGDAYDIIAEQPIMPTSELPSHLAMHAYMREVRGTNNKVVLHTHPTDLIALTHVPEFLEEGALAYMLWSMIPETRIIVPKGVGIIPYEIPGTMDLADATIEKLAKHDVVMWEKHGCLAVGEDLIETFDAIDTLSKSSQIFFYAKQAGYQPQGMKKEQLDGLVDAFNL
jgi:rhamnulose-1-phosphate aldolase